MQQTAPGNPLAPLPLKREQILKDYQTAFASRQASIAGRKEVLSGKAKFGIFGDGKEVAQVAMAHAFRKGDWRSGYYRDQTLMFALGMSDVKKFFAQLYADADPTHEPSSAGRQMNAHFSTRYLDRKGQWLNQLMMYNSSADMSPTAGQMARLLGLGYASKLYRGIPNLDAHRQFSDKGQEVAFGTIGDASTSEGIFWEVINAAGVLQVPLVMSVWDDGYGISVPKKYQTTKESISTLLSGFHPHAESELGVSIVKVAGWDYPSLLKAYTDCAQAARTMHRPQLIHVYDLTQPQGHSTSGSHERYKTPERMQFEQSFDCLQKMKDWMVASGIASSEEITLLEEQASDQVQRQRNEAWEELIAPIAAERTQILKIYQGIEASSSEPDAVNRAINDLKRLPVLQRRALASSMKRVLISYRNEPTAPVAELARFWKTYQSQGHERYSSFAYLESENSCLNTPPVPVAYAAKPELVDGSQIIRSCFDHHLKTNPKVFIIGEDVGHLGGVNTEFDGLQEKYGLLRVTDTGIREASILGQGIGAAMRGLRPVVDIQYLDYVLYCLQGMSDDLATLHFRSAGGQVAPVIVRTKGHRLEGIWHTGSPMGTILNAVRGMLFCVPRNMVQAAGMYNTLFTGDDPAFVVEVLNGYRVKEALPQNLAEFKLALGVPEILRQGEDATIVTYGACVRIAEDACNLLAQVGVNCELIDVQTLLPFDRSGIIGESLKKTNALIVFDEDVPGGASSYILKKILEDQQAYDFLDAQPKTLTAKEHRGAYASDGDYYSKPNAEDLFDTVYALMHERDPYRFPNLPGML